jgi:hypothetical protein
VLRYALLGLHGAGIASLLTTQLPMAGMVLVFILLLASAAHSLSWGVPRTLRCQQSGKLELQGEGGWSELSLTSKPTLLPWLMLLRCREFSANTGPAQ